MIKTIALVRRRPGISHEEFVRYWINEHAPMVKTLLPGLRKYVLNVVIPSADGREPEFDGVVELGFDNMNAMNAALSSPGWLSAERQQSSDRFLDLEHIVSICTEEHIVVE